MGEAIIRACSEESSIGVVRRAFDTLQEETSLVSSALRDIERGALFYLSQIAKDDDEDDHLI
jgi:hypothetical protein